MDLVPGNLQKDLHLLTGRDSKLRKLGVLDLPPEVLEAEVVLESTRNRLRRNLASPFGGEEEDMVGSPLRTVVHRNSDSGLPLNKVVVGGRLANFPEAWEDVPTSPYIRSIVNSGLRITFLELPPRFSGVKGTPMGGNNRQVILDEVQSLLEKGAIEPVPPNHVRSGFYSTIFVVPKKSGGLRPIINLKPLNRFLRVPSFKMESLQNVIRSIKPLEWLATIDLKDAYFHVAIHQASRKYLRFAVQNKSYQFRALPFGISSAPCVITKVLDPVIAVMRLRGIHCHPYLDDLLFRATSPEILSQHVQETIQILISVGFLFKKICSFNLPKTLH
jgi:hypothetical protein